jgi:hypothetical protein
MSGTANDFPARTDLLSSDFFWTKRGSAAGAEGLTPAEVVLNEVAGLETQQPITAAEDIGSGRFVHILPDGTAVYAHAATNRPAQGFTREAIVAGQTLSMRASGKLTGMSGLTPGAVYYLSGTTPGLAVLTPPSSGLVQRLGQASAAHTLMVTIEQPILIE